MFPAQARVQTSVGIVELKSAVSNSESIPLTCCEVLYRKRRDLVKVNGSRTSSQEGDCELRQTGRDEQVISCRGRNNGVGAYRKSPRGYRGLPVHLVVHPVITVML